MTPTLCIHAPNTAAVTVVCGLGSTPPTTVPQHLSFIVSGEVLSPESRPFGRRPRRPWTPESYPITRSFSRLGHTWSGVVGTRQGSRIALDRGEGRSRRNQRRKRCCAHKMHVTPIRRRWSTFNSQRL